MIEEDRKLIVTDENNNQIEMEIMFTFDKDGKNYVVYHNPLNDKENDIEVFASTYDEEGNLFPVESDEEWDMIEEVLDTFLEDQEEQAEK